MNLLRSFFILAIWLLSSGPFYAQSADGGVSETPLDIIREDLSGLISLGDIGLEEGILAQNTAQELALAWRPARDMVPALAEAFSDLARASLLIAIDEPSAEPSSFFLARVDHLRMTGRIDEAAEMLARVGTKSAAHFTRYLATHLWLEAADAVCPDVHEVPSGAHLMDFIFCVASNGDFAKAVVLAENARELSLISDREAAVLLHFLDPELYPIGNLLLGVSEETDLLTYMRRSLGLGEARSLKSLGAEYQAVNGFAPWRSKIESAETLASLGGVDHRVLWLLYSKGTPSASGALWERVSTAQRIALDQERDIEAAIPIFDAVGLLPAFANHLSEDDYRNLSTNAALCLRAMNKEAEDDPNLFDAYQDAGVQRPLLSALLARAKSTNFEGVDLINALSNLTRPESNSIRIAEDLSVLDYFGWSGRARQIALQIYATRVWCQNVG